MHVLHCMLSECRLVTSNTCATSVSFGRLEQQAGFVLASCTGLFPTQSIAVCQTLILSVEVCIYI